MTAALAPRFRRMARARGRARAEAIRDLLALEAPWADWLAALNEVHVRDPRLEASMGAELAAAAERAGRRREGARFRLVRARALHRVGSPAEAVEAFRDAAVRLRREGEIDQALKADILNVDALAHAGRSAQALRLAARAGEALRSGAHPDKRWGAVLETNRANVLRLEGRLEEALTSYERSARRFEAAGEPEMAAIAEANAGVAWLDVGEPTRARRHFEAALPIFLRRREQDRALDVRENLACALGAEGALGASIRLFTSLVAEHERRGLTRRAASCRMDLSEVLRRAGDRSSAAAEARRAARGLERVGAYAELVEALWLAAEASSSAPEARALLDRAQRAARRTRRPGIVLRCELLGYDLAARAGHAPSERALAKLEQRARALGHVGVVSEVLLLQAQAALQAGRIATARRVLSRAELRRSARPWIRAAAETGLARCEARAGRPDLALRRLRRVAGFLDAVRAGLPGPWLRTRFVLERMDPYLARVDLLLARGRPADRLEAEAVLDALAARRFLERRRPQGPGAMDALRRRLEALYDRLVRGDGPRRGLAARESLGLEREARRLERRAAGLWRAAERRRRGTSGVAIAGARSASLARDVAIVHVWKREQEVWGLVRRRAQVEAAVNLGSVQSLVESLARLAFHAERLRLFPGTTRAEPLHASLAELARRLLEPLGAERWPARVRLVLDPSVPDLPWELLPTAKASVPLCGAHEVLRVPAARLRPVRSRAGRGRAVLAVGEPDLGAIRRELTGAGARARRLEGRAVSRQALQEALERHDSVHVAGHGFDAPEAPAWGGIRVADGWFGPADVPARIAARQVLLSACRSGREEGLATEAWGALPSTLLAAGARFVAWTAADVEDEAAADVMTRFYRLSTRRTPARAMGLALGQLAAERGHAGALLPYRLGGIAP